MNLIWIDSHSGARPKCAKDQGKIFSLDNTSGTTEDLHRRKDREQVVGFDKRISAESVASNKRKYKEFAEKVGKENAPDFTEYSKAGYNKSKEYKELKEFAK